MNISINNAHENNLKNISVTIPIGQIIGLTGVSGSGKSTLLKNIIAAYGARRFTNFSTKTVKDSLRLSDRIKVDSIENLPQTMFIDVKSSVSNPISTVSTISGIHETLRNLFVEYGKIQCQACKTSLEVSYKKDMTFVVDLVKDESFSDALLFISTEGNVLQTQYFDKDGKLTTTEKNKMFATVKFNFKNPTKNKIEKLNRNFRCKVKIESENNGECYDALNEMECTECHAIVPTNRRGRYSYITCYDEGGGACHNCAGKGKISFLDYEKLVIDSKKGILDGAVQLVDKKGIKYTTVTEKFLAALFKALDIDIKTPIENLSEVQKNVIFYGYDDKITFVDRVGGKKELVFKGISNYLVEAYSSGKGQKVLSGLIEEKICPSCNGSRMDWRLNAIKVRNKSFSDLLLLSLDELNKWFCSIDNMIDHERTYVERIKSKLDNYAKVSCGHLSMNRSSNSLSGGELQRIRLCSLLNSKVSGICYLLDEPSSGLHYQDIDKLGNLLRELCDSGNTLIMVEHNLRLLEYCDYIIDMGPKGGKDGGNILFQTEIDKISDYSTSTALCLSNKKNEMKVVLPNLPKVDDMIAFKNLNVNNLKNLSIDIPRKRFSTICGISGSGKSTLVKHVIYKQVSKSPELYGFKSVNYIGQDKTRTSNISTVGSLLKLNEYISKNFEKSGSLSRNNFMPGKTEGKCVHCKGKGILVSENEEMIGICEKCNGMGYSKETLSVLWCGLNIYQIFNMAFNELAEKIADTKIKKVTELAELLGIGYLTLKRSSNSLSKGEFQRVSLINALANNEKESLIILDEPSKGMHFSDTNKLLAAIRKVVENNNTVIAVEHNPNMIRNSDYVIELGGTGVTGGYLLYSGIPSDLKDTPTAEMIHEKESDLVRCKENLDSDDIVFEINAKELRFKPRNLYVVTENIAELIETAKKTREDYLSVAIPNNIFFSKSKQNMLDGNLPLITTIDFNENCSVVTTVGMILGFNTLLSEIVGNVVESDVLQYVFDSESPTGKCKKCQGTGSIYSIDEKFFFDEEDMTKECKKFLRNSTNFTDVKNIIKKKLRLDFGKKVIDMSEKEKVALVWGIDEILEDKGYEYNWEGLVSLFLRFHKYYPDDKAELIFKKKEQIKCPKCDGNRLQYLYQKETVLGLSYSEWYTLSISEIIRLVKWPKEKDVKISSLKKCLGILEEIGLGSIHFSDKVSLLQNSDIGKLKLVNELLNATYDAGIMITNLEMLLPNEQEIIVKLLEELSVNTTIWILKKEGD